MDRGREVQSPHGKEGQEAAGDDGERTDGQRAVIEGGLHRELVESADSPSTIRVSSP